MNSQTVVFLFSSEDSRTPRERVEFARGQRGETVLPSDWQVLKEEKGKPFCSDRKELGLSISHSAGLWGCALQEGAVGLDLQEERMRADLTPEETAAQCRRLARRFYHRDEAAFVEDGVDSGAVVKRFFALWTAKESLVKYTGRGIDDSFGAVSVLPKEREAFLAALEEGGPFSWRAEELWFSWLRPEPEMSLCLCTKEQTEVTVKRVSE